MTETSEGKSSFEVLKWLLVFQRISKSFTGLLLLEIGWVVLLTLASKLTEEGSTPVLGVPGFLRLKRPFLEISNVPETTIWVVGALSILAGWTLYSRFVQYIFVPLIAVSKLVLTLAFLVIWPVTVLVSIALLPLTIPLEALMLRRWSATHKKNWIRQHTGQGPDGEALYTEWLNDEKNRSDLARQRTWAREDLTLKPNILLNGLLRIQRIFLLPLYSGIRIGVAPIVTHPRIDELPVAIPPFQNLGALVVGVRTLLDDLGIADDLDFYLLPSHFRVSTDGQARLARWYFAADLIAWGGFLDEAGDTIWLKFQGSLSRRKQNEDDDKQGQEREANLFPGSYVGFKPEVPAVSFTARDNQEAFNALLLAISEALSQEVRRHKRRNENWPREIQWFQQFVRWIREVLLMHQQLSLSQVLERILVYLVYESFGKLPDEPPVARFIPSPAAQLVQLVGGWIGYQFTSAIGITDDSFRKKIPPERFILQLRWLSEKCTKIKPDEADHLYRLGAVLCMLGEEEGALLAFKEAASLDSHSYRIDRLTALTFAQVALEDARPGRNDRDLAAVRFAAHAARAINTGNAFVVEQVLKAMEESLTVKLARLGPKKAGAVTAISVIDKMVSEVGPTPSTAAPTS